MRKQIFTILAGLLMSGASYAGVMYLNPIADYNFRTNGTVTSAKQDDPTGWHKNGDDIYPKASASTINCEYGAKLWGQQMYDVTGVDFETVTAVSLSFVITYTTNNKNYHLGAWIYPGAGWQEQDSLSWVNDTCHVVETFKKVVGAYPAHTTETKTTSIAHDESAEPQTAQIINFTGDALTSLKNGIITKGDKKYLTFIISFYETNIYGTRRIDYKSGHNADVADRPKLTITTNAKEAQIGETEYDTFNDALSAVTDGQTIELLSNASITSQVRKDGVNFTIDGNNHMLYNCVYTTPFLTSTGNITLKDLTIDGHNANITGNLVEAGKSATFTMQNVTINNVVSEHNSGILCVKGTEGATLNLTDVAFNNCRNTGDKQALILLGNTNCTVSNSLTFTNCEGNEIFVQNDNRVNVSGATSVLNLTFDSNRNADKAAVIGSTDVSKFYVTNEDPNAWELYVSGTELKARKYEAHSTPLSIGDALMATLVLGYNCDIPAGLKAYKLTNEGEPDIYAKEQMSIKRNEPVLIIAEDAGSYTFETGTGVRLDEQANPESGCLRGTYSESPVAVPNNDEAGTYNYILTKVDEEVGFFHANSDGTNTVTKNHAYLFTTYNAVPPATGAPAKRMRLVFDSEEQATGIHDAAVSEKAEKLLIDGVLYIRKADHLYRIDGQIVK